ncbi:MAG: hypothetical protein SFX18_15735 [Pirellulales bacterium]|nr:hypothetical protein [Pirellulales bacterium]
MSSNLLPPTALFRFNLACRWHAQIGQLGRGILDAGYGLPYLAQLDGAPPLVDLRVGWNNEGVQFWLSLAGKSQAPWCRENRLDDSDGLHVWLDTRDTHNIHRASRFCHHFFFMPHGAGPRLDQPLADQLLINRARENANPIRPRQLQVAASRQERGYTLEAFIPAGALTGFDPAEYPRLGFFACVADRELGPLPLALNDEFPYDEDPSLWMSLELLRE